MKAEQYIQKKIIDFFQYLDTVPFFERTHIFVEMIQRNLWMLPGDDIQHVQRLTLGE